MIWTGRNFMDRTIPVYILHDTVYCQNKGKLGKQKSLSLNKQYTNKFMYLNIYSY